MINKTTTHLFLNSILCLLMSMNMFAVDFVLFTQPKTGTHLIKPILAELAQRNFFSALGYHDKLEEAWELNNQKMGTFLHLHAAYSKQKEKFLIQKKCIVFYILRDPRDQVVSLLNHYKHIRFIDRSIEAIPTDEQRLLKMIHRDLRYQTISYNKWIDSTICCVLDFSKLMGAHGGAATDEDAVNELWKIAIALKIDTTHEYLAYLYKKHFGKGGTFLQGKVGAWKDYFNSDHKIEAKHKIGDLLISLGFEKNLNW